MWNGQLEIISKQNGFTTMGQGGFFCVESNGHAIIISRNDLMMG
jgi:hypothetical protein